MLLANCNKILNCGNQFKVYDNKQYNRLFTKTIILGEGVACQKLCNAQIVRDPTGSTGNGVCDEWRIRGHGVCTASGDTIAYLKDDYK